MARLQKKDALYERALAVIPGGMYGHEDIRYLTEDFGSLPFCVEH